MSLFRLLPALLLSFFFAAPAAAQTIAQAPTTVQSTLR